VPTDSAEQGQAVIANGVFLFDDAASASSALEVHRTEVIPQVMTGAEELAVDGVGDETYAFTFQSGPAGGPAPSTGSASATSSSSSPEAASRSIQTCSTSWPRRSPPELRNRAETFGRRDEMSLVGSANWGARGRRSPGRGRSAAVPMALRLTAHIMSGFAGRSSGFRALLGLDTALQRARPVGVPVRIGAMGDPQPPSPSLRLTA
jgi:hypothetical protein